MLFTVIISYLKKYQSTRISGPYGLIKILAPAESSLASLTRMFSSLTRKFASLKYKSQSTSTSSWPPPPTT